MSVPQQPAGFFGMAVLIRERRLSLRFRVIVDCDMETRVVAPAEKNLRIVKDRTPIVSSLPAELVPSEIENEDVKREAFSSESADLLFEIVRGKMKFRCHIGSGEILIVEICHPDAEAVPGEPSGYCRTGVRIPSRHGGSHDRRRSHTSPDFLRPPWERSNLLLD